MLYRSVKPGPDHVAVILYSDPMLQKRAKARIKVENDDLIDTGSQKTLQKCQA